MSDFLYPFIEGDERGTTALLSDLARSAEAKAGESWRLRTATIDTSRAQIDEAAAAMASRFMAGGQLFVFGNGGSASDAEGIVSLFVRPPTGRPLPARPLADEAVLTALGNDVGFDLVFSRQLIAHARRGDIAMAVSTSGSSTNLLAGLAEARRLGMITIGMAGYDGGQMAASADVDHCFVIAAESVHRIQEAQAALAVELWSAVHRELDENERDVS